MSNLKISPPWYTLRNLIANSIGMNPLITVSELIPKSSSNYIINLKTTSDSIANSLRTILPSVYTFGPIKVSTVILNSKSISVIKRNPTSTRAQVAQNFCNVLHNNTLFKGVFIPPSSNPFLNNSVFVIIDKAIIQFYNDDISDIFQNFNEIASKVFSNLLIRNFNSPPIYINFSTYDEEKFSQLQIFCS